MDRTGIIEIESFWAKRTCEQTIANLESVGFNHATVSTDTGEKFALHARNNRRVIFEDDELVDALWSDLLPHIPMDFGNSKACGLNEMFRSYKYEPGQKFQKHRDQSFIRNEFEASYFTVLIYLNEGFKGGETIFETRKIIPKMGKCVIFPHHLEHEGAEVNGGTKYVLRTDIMFRLREE